MFEMGRRAAARATIRTLMRHVGGGSAGPHYMERTMKRHFHTQGGCGGMVSMIAIGFLVFALWLFV